MYVYTYVCVHLYVYVQMLVYVYIYTYINAYIHTYIHTYVHTYINTYIHTYTHTYILESQVYRNSVPFIAFRSKLHVVATIPYRGLRFSIHAKTLKTFQTYVGASKKQEL